MDFLEGNGRSYEVLLEIIQDFLVEQQPNARKEVAIAAGAIRFGQEHGLFEGPYWSMKDIAEKFKVSTSTMYKYYVEIEAYYERTNELAVNV
jgi:hypothetical protein